MDRNAIAFKVQEKVDFGFSNFNFDKSAPTKISSANVNYETLRTELVRLIELVTKGRKFENFQSLFIYGPTGVGKCFYKGTKILMYDGTIKNVEDIIINDVIMGVNSKPKTVISTTSGKEMMYDIIPIKGEKYRVNESHILSLKMTNTTSHGKLINGKIINISVKDYLQKSKYFKHCAKGYREKVETFNSIKTDIKYLEPYFLGLWLGDGNSRWTDITNIDKEVINYLRDFTDKYDFQLTEEDITYRITDKKTKSKNRLVEEMRLYNLFENKHVPFQFKTGSSFIRKEILAGLIDSDGSYYHGCFDFISKSRVLSNDVAFMARSLGLAAYIKPSIKSAHKKHRGVYYRVCISGNLDIIPTKIKRKQATARKQKKDVLVTGIKVVSAGIGDYYGFELDKGDKRFLLGDFTVTHNTEIIKAIAEEFDCIYHKLEIQKIPVEEFEGFPYLEDRDGTKVTRLASPTVLPPSGDDRVWLLHLDEFNKADSDKMAAVMNLVLTGEIGGSADFNFTTGKSEKYRLPERTIIIGSGNFKSQENTENLNLVNQMDIATTERFHKIVLLEYDAESWLKNFAIKNFSFRFNGDSHTVSSRIAPILMYFIMDKMREEGNRSPFLIPISFRPEEGGGERTASPRSWTLVSDNMLLDAIVNFDKLTPSEYKKYSAKSEEMFGNDERAFDMFFQDPDNQVKLLATQSNEFGLEGHKVVAEIISRYAYFAENRILAEEILFEYEKVKEKILLVKNKTGVILYLLISAGYALDKVKKEDAGELKRIAASLSTYFEDTDISSEDLCAFIYIVYNSKNEIAKEVHSLLNTFSKRYKNAFGDFYHTSKREI